MIHVCRRRFWPGGRARAQGYRSGRLSRGSRQMAARSADRPCTAPIGFCDLDLNREQILELLDMRDNQDLLEILLDRGNGLNQSLAPASVLRSKALVNDQGFQTGAGATGQELGQGDTDGK